MFATKYRGLLKSGIGNTSGGIEGENDQLQIQAMALVKKIMKREN